MPRKRTGYDAACYYDGKLLGRCTKADSDAYTLLMNACGGDAARVKGGAHAGGPEPDGRDVPCAPDLSVGRGAEL